MNREILFKAKRIDNGEWVEGYLFRLSEKLHPFIMLKNRAGDGYEVDENTVCQYTGLTDKDGKKIWENDIVKFKHGGEFSEKGIYYRNYVVEFVNTFVTYGLRLRNKSIHFPFKQATASMHDVEVIGNIFDNPELLNQ